MRMNYSISTHPGMNNTDGISIIDVIISKFMQIYKYYAGNFRSKFNMNRKLTMYCITAKAPKKYIYNAGKLDPAPFSF